MADSSGPASPAPDPATTGESKAQREARLRRERRNAKVQAGGSDRLNKITTMSGRPAAAEADFVTDLNRPSPSQSRSTSHTRPASKPQAPPQPTASNPNHEDPDEVDISNMFQRPAPTSSNRTDSPFRTQEDMLRQMLRAPDPNDPNTQGQNPNGNMSEDPMMRMMQQMLGGAGGAGGTGGGGLPPGLASMLGGGETEQAGSANSADYLWRIVHALFALLLAVYAVSTLAFTSTSFTRHSYVSSLTHDNEHTGSAQLFYLFATAELVLQSTRYFVDRGRLPRIGWMSKVAGFLPEPYAGYVRVVSRYSIIYTTVVGDAFVVVFVLGVVAWWKGLGGA